MKLLLVEDDLPLQDAMQRVLRVRLATRGIPARSDR